MTQPICNTTIYALFINETTVKMDSRIEEETRLSYGDYNAAVALRALIGGFVDDIDQVSETNDPFEFNYMLKRNGLRLPLKLAEDLRDRIVNRFMIREAVFDVMLSIGGASQRRLYLGTSYYDYDPTT